MRLELVSGIKSFDDAAKLSTVLISIISGQRDVKTADFFLRKFMGI